MSVLIQIIGPKKKKHNFHLQNWRTPLQTTSGDRRKQIGSDLLCDPIHSNASNPQDLPAASLLATSGCCRTDTSTSWLINLLGTHEKGPLISQRPSRF